MATAKPRSTCIITGGGRGIGRATAMELDQRGWNLALLSRTTDEIVNTAEGLARALPITADVTKVPDIQAAIAQTIEEFGQIDAVVNCAGAAPLVPIEKMTDEQFRLAVDTNLGHVFYMTRAIWPHFKSRKAGVIVNISSLAARDPFDGFGAYGAAKAAINNFSLVAAHEGAAHNIRVHVVAPGAVETAMLRSAFPTTVLPTERTLSPECVAKVIAQVVAGDLACTSGEVLWVHK